MMVVSDLDDVFVPLTDDFLVNLFESRSVVESTFQDNMNVESAFGPALKASLMLMEYDLRIYGSDKEHPLRLPEDPFYKQMAAEFTKFQIGVDMHAFSDKYTYIASIVVALVGKYALTIVFSNLLH
ncbi:hypothetical protein C1H46_006158 [Malus baccata]|uniref:Sec23/Sec24 trunk domain-containing protein n=1 Tax=Malus baccata TaxID=106549 RepID=A0A540NAW6_MALBA|nr:hypothetical protein C1H46_006158 [Malus baccata]